MEYDDLDILVRDRTKCFVSGDTEVLIPQLHGGTPLRARSTSTRKTDQDAFLAACDQRGRQFFSSLLSNAESAGLSPDWAAVAFTIAITVDDQRVPILRGYPAAAARGSV